LLIINKNSKLLTMNKFLHIILFSVFIFLSFAASPGNGSWPQSDVKPLESNELKVYPNPAENGRVTLELNNGMISEIRLINIAGKEAAVQKMDFETPKYTLELVNVPNGIYFIRVKTTENKVVVKKLVVSGR
jgi:hypothetical protein